MNFGLGNVFNGMFGPVKPGMCKLGVNGQVAIKTSSGYKTYNLNKNRLVNCTNFAFDVDGAFYVVPAFKVNRGDIVLINGNPCCVIEVNEVTGNIKVFSYENSTIDEVVPERHVFMGKTYCYGKIYSPFMGMNNKGNDMLSKMLGMQMASSMFSGMFGNASDNSYPNGYGQSNNTNQNSMMSMMPWMMFMGGGSNPFMEMFDGAFNFGEEEDEKPKKKKTVVVEEEDEEDDVSDDMSND